MKKVFLLVCLITIIAMFLSCAKKEPPPEEVPDLEVQLITHKTMGFISPAGKIKVRFRVPKIKPEQVGLSLKEKVFHFSPDIDGITKWETTQIIVLTPSKPLKPNQSYEGYLDLERLFPAVEALPPDKIVLNFETTGRMISSIDADFELVDEADPTRLKFAGKIAFNMGTPIEDMRKALKLFEDKKRLEFEIEPDTHFTFKFVSSELQRDDKSRMIYLRIDDDVLDLEKPFEKDYKLPQLRKFEFTGIEHHVEGEDIFLELKFSDLLDPRRDYGGFVQTDPPVELKLKANENRMIARGDFKFGTKYRVSVLEGLCSKWGTCIDSTEGTDVSLPSLLPQIAFSSKGVFLPSTNQKSVNFRTVNLREVNVKVEKVFENNLGFFIQENVLESSKFRNTSFQDVRRVGVIAKQMSLDLGEEPNRWLQSQLDLNELIDDNEKGLYIIELSFYNNDVITGLPKHWSSSRKNQFFNQQNRIYKPIILSDIGITAKKTSEGIIVIVTDVVGAKPIPSAKVSLKSYQNQVIEEGRTDRNGIYHFKEAEPYFVEAEYNGQRSVLLFKNDALSTSLFDVGGASDASAKTRAFIYTDRGVYRPGDEIHLSVIARNQQNTFPTDHPVTLKLYNPLNRLVLEETSRKSVDGFYSFSVETEETAPTGNWSAILMIGHMRFTHLIKVETVVPYRLKVKVESEKPVLTLADSIFPVKVTANYLFGNPAAGLDCDLSFKLDVNENRFGKYKDFHFTHEGILFDPIQSKLYELTLNQKGEKNFNWQLPKLGEVPCPLKATALANVYERGGRFVPGTIEVPIHPYEYYVGINAGKNRFVNTGSTLSFQTLLVSREGKPVEGRTLHYRIYMNEHYWWYDYDKNKVNRKHFKTRYATRELTSGRITSGSVPINIEFLTSNYGMLLIEVQDGESGHTAGYFLNVRDYGAGPEIKDADLVSIKTDKEKYYPGDVAKIIFQSPPKGRALLSVEKGREVLYTRWRELNAEETVMEIPVTEEMVSTAYAFVSVFQPHSQTANDRPIRLYGVAPLNVEGTNTRINMDITTSAKFTPGEEFTISVQTLDSSQVQYTIAVVDEGLLALTNYQTPDPLAFFFRKEALLVKTFDIYSNIIGFNWGEIFKKFSLGGGIEALKKLMPTVKVRRFKPVALFSGPLFTDTNGSGTVTFRMPEYVGAVRVMVVAAKENRYGSAEKTVPVTSPLMVLSSLPRVLGPEDNILVSVTVFAMEDGVGKTEVSIEVEGVIKVKGDKEITLDFAEKAEREVYFEIGAEAAVGACKIKISAASGKFKTSSTTDIAVRSSNPWISISESKLLEPGKLVKFDLPNDGLPGTNTAKLTISRVGKLNLENHLRWLVRYPYGCVEQTTSSVFPQLYLKDIAEIDAETIKKIDENINAGIERLRQFQVSSGGFTYWPSRGNPQIWATNYAGHFLVEAKKLGYYVPESMYKSWLEYQISAARDRSGGNLERVYRLYILALADKPQTDAMNLLKQNYLSGMNNPSKWFLAASYQLAGAEKPVKEIMKDTGLEIEEYTEFAGTYGSNLRDQAIILEILTLMGEMSKAQQLYQKLSDKISHSGRHSTQTTAYTLLALGKYLRTMDFKENPTEGEIKMPGGDILKFTTAKPTFNFTISEGFGEKISVKILSEGSVFGTLEWEGIPLKANIPTLSKGINLERKWYNEDGVLFDPSELKQGQTFWGYFKVENPNKFQVEEIALVQILPAGWEIENIRLTGEHYPDWSKGFKLDREEYLDIRDDRVMWFFDLPYRQNLEFMVKLNAVTVGSFHLPACKVEAMYNDKYVATIAGEKVIVMMK